MHSRIATFEDDMNPMPDAAPAERLMSVHEVREVTQRSRTAIYRDMSEGLFPRPVPIGRLRNGKPAKVAWLASDIQKWIQAQVAQARREVVALETAAEEVPIPPSQRGGHRSKTQPQEGCAQPA
jgi:predicted DNA-binding transcriptional regulator AlpA